MFGAPASTTAAAAAAAGAPGGEILRSTPALRGLWRSDWGRPLGGIFGGQ